MLSVSVAINLQPIANSSRQYSVPWENSVANLRKFLEKPPEQAFRAKLEIP
jgi:hypothetical protein